MITANQCGLVGPPADAAAFADALEAAANDQVALKEMGVRSSALARREPSSRFVQALESAAQKDARQ